MGWLSNGFKAIAEGFTFFRQERNPEVKRLNRIEYLKKERDKKKIQRDILTAKQYGSEDDEDKKNKYAYELGNVTDSLIRLRIQIAELKK